MRELLDPDFDEMGGELTYSQIREPLISYQEDPSPYLIRYRRHERIRLRQQQVRLARLTLRLWRVQRRTWPRFHFQHNPVCDKCVPYNWQFTPGYWATGQKDLWV